MSYPPEIQNQLPQTKLMDVLMNPPTMNTMNNIIAGPNFRDYWKHSPGFTSPEYPEEGPLPIQGNIGSLLSNEADNYTKCSTSDLISGSPNCTAAFRPDLYTLNDTCGANCYTKNPEIYGIQNFGITDPNGITNVHTLDLNQNIRRGAAGQDSSSGCYDWLPVSQPGPNGACVPMYNPALTQVGDWTTTNEFSNLVNVYFPKQSVAPAPTQAPQQQKQQKQPQSAMSIVSESLRNFWS